MFYVYILLFPSQKNEKRAHREHFNNLHKRQVECPSQRYTGAYQPRRGFQRRKSSSNCDG